MHESMYLVILVGTILVLVFYHLVNWGSRGGTGQGAHEVTKAL